MLINKGFDSNVENLRTRVFVKKVQVKSRANFEGKESAKQASSEKSVPALPSRNKINNTYVKFFLSHPLVKLVKTQERSFQRSENSLVKFDEIFVT